MYLIKIKPSKAVCIETTMLSLRRTLSYLMITTTACLGFWSLWPTFSMALTPPNINPLNPPMNQICGGGPARIFFCQPDSLVRETRQQNTLMPMLFKIVDQGQELWGQWQGKEYRIKATDITVQMRESSSETSNQNDNWQEFSGQRFILEPALDPDTGNIAIAMVINDQSKVERSAVVIIEPQPNGYIQHVVQVPGTNPLPNRSATYGLRHLRGINYWDKRLQIKQADDSGSLSLLVFEPADTPAGRYVFCSDLKLGKNGSLCPPEQRL